MGYDDSRSITGADVCGRCGDSEDGVILDDVPWQQQRQMGGLPMLNMRL